MNVTNQGSTDYREQPGSPDYHFQMGRASVRRHFQGLWSWISDPANGILTTDIIGFSMVDLGTDYFVVDLVAKRLEGGWGSVLYEIENQNNPGWGAPIYDCEWVALEKDLVTNPRYQSTGAKPLTPGDLVDLARWKAVGPINNADLKYSYLGNYGPVALSANATDAAAKTLAGTSAYKIWYPVISAESYSFSVPAPWKGGVPEDPPTEANKPDGYVWQRSGCRRRYERGRYTLRKEWIGVEKIDTDLYPSS